MAERGLNLLKATEREIWRAAAVGAGITIGITLLQLTVPLYMMLVFDRVLNSRSIETLSMLTIIMSVGLMMYVALDFLRARVFLMAGHVLSSRLNGAAFEAAIADTLKGEAANANQAIRDLNDLRGFLTGSAVLAPMDMLLVPVIVIFLFLLHPMYGILALIGSAVMLTLSVVNEFAIRRSLLDANGVAMKSYAAIGSATRNGEVLEAMGMVAAVSRRWQTSQKILAGHMIRSTDRGKIVVSLSKGVRLGLNVSVIVTATVLVLSHSASPGSMMAAMILTSMAVGPFESLIETYRQWVFAYAGHARLKALLSRTDTRCHGMVLPAPNPQVRVEKLVFLPPGHDRVVIKGISFQIEAGEVLGIIGPSGSGKSTLARLLVGVWEPTSGGVYLDGHNVYTWTRENFGRYVGYLPQNIGLLDGTIRDNIARMGDADPRDVVEAARLADVHELIGRLPFGYESQLEDTNFILSGGQRQRIALARALFGSPRLIVLDEPNSNLDQAGEAALIAAIKAAKANGSTVVIIAHRPSVLAMADKLLALKDGVIEHFGPREDVVRFSQLNAPSATSVRQLAPAKPGSGQAAGA